ncbi:MAG: hypothetical protein II603_01595, partial [Muribaculaceae bacterium]|nr:hypothetical protein [Muribaculaceae bacterium]
MQEIIEEGVKKTTRKNSNTGVQIKEFLMACLRNWYWFVISIIICGSLAYLYSKSQIQQYRSQALILLTTSTSKSTGSQSQVFSDLGITPASNFIPNEIYKITSTELMEEVVNQLGLNIQYYGHVYLRDVNSYKTSPLQITPLREITTPFTMTVVPKGGNDLEYKINDGPWAKAKFGNKVNTAFGPIAITKTQKFTDHHKDFQVIVRVKTIHDAAVAYKAHLTAESPEKYTDVLRLTMTCDNPRLATDILNALIAVYIQDAINDKNRVSRNTEAFISDRIVTIAEDLSGVDSKVAQLKVGSVNATMFSDPSTGVRLAENANNANMQYSLANEILQYVSRMNGNELIPSNTGIANTGIESQIAQYNEAMLKYQKIAATSSSENPVMIELTNSLAAMKSTIVNSLSNYLNSLRMQVSNARSQEGRATSSMTAVPSHEKALTQVTRQQQIKEQLYLYLLNKREENALQLAITEPNAKVIEKAVSTGQIAPVPSKIMSTGLLLGLLLPALVLFAIYWIKSLDTMVHTRGDVEQNCGLPIIGDVPE